MKFLLSYPPAKAELWLRVSEHWPFLRWLKLETEVELQLSRSCIQSANQRASTCILCTACTWKKFVPNLSLPRNPLQRLFIPLKIDLRNTKIALSWEWSFRIFNIACRKGRSPGNKKKFNNSFSFYLLHSKPKQCPLSLPTLIN
jgi:hypothetical protein